MLGRNPLRSGLRRPKALRFDSPFSLRDGPTAFGDGAYSGNILQGGRVLQPQNYVLPGGDLLRDCIVITGAATVDPDAETVAAAFMCRNLVLSGAGATLSASTNCKGLLGFVSGRTVLRDGASLHMNKLGRAGNFGDLSPDMLLPASFIRHVATDKLKVYVVRGEGALGGLGVHSPGRQNVYGNTGASAGPMQTGGGGSGGAYGDNGPTSGNGGKGGPCCGGAGSGAAIGNWVSGAGADYGGPGGNGVSDGGWGAGGGAGDPPGLGVSGGGTNGQGAGGGLLMLFSSAITVGTGCLISATGALGGTGSICGGSAGGGCICIVTAPNQFVNHGTVSAAGGSVVGDGGGGGVGSVNVFELTE